MVRSLVVFMIFLAPWAGAAAAPSADGPLTSAFDRSVRPFLAKHCLDCHGAEQSEADLNLAAYSSMDAAAQDSGHWTAIIGRLEAGQMPPKKVKARPSDDERRRVIGWFRSARDEVSKRNAGDPGVVLARRLSNAEYDYTVRDLTGVDIRPAAEFPIDPANPAGFDNSGESLVMSPSLLKKYLEAARLVSTHLVLKQQGFEFAPFPAVADTDRDKYCVQRIIAFYRQQNIDLADYFLAAWAYKNRDGLGRADQTLHAIASERRVSAKYLQTIWATLNDPIDPVGPLVKLQAMWRELPPAALDQPEIVRRGCETMRDYVVGVRKKVEPRFRNITAGRIGAAEQPLLIWKNVQYATHRMSFDPAQLQVANEPPAPAVTEPEPGADNEFGPGHTIMVNNQRGDPDLVVPRGERARYEAAFARFCRVFPDRFYMDERGRNYFDTSKDRGRYLNAGFHSLMGYFRDDQPLYELILNDAEQKELDQMWRDLDFVASASERTYIQFCPIGRRKKESTADASEKAVSTETVNITSEAEIRRLEESYLARAQGGDPRGIDAIRSYFGSMNDAIRWTEKARLGAEPSHLDSLVRFATSAYRRQLSKREREGVLDYYRTCRKEGLDHESAIREGVVAVLMSPDFCYRLDLAPPADGAHALSDYELASRLSYFLWSSMPDAELLACAAAGDLHKPAILSAQTRRMLRSPKVRALAIEFAGSWLDFRRFDAIATVDRNRFPAFTDALRDAMYEEPIRLLVDALQNNLSMLDLVDGDYTFVNRPLAEHYGMPAGDSSSDRWIRVEHASRYRRGGLLGMAAFMTKNAPGLRTSPVKRGNWVVKNILGERIPAPPPNVPELPRDEATSDLPLRDMLAKHREDPSCAACHARFDSFGLVFEGFGPVGERREHDLAGRAVDASAVFPDGTRETGVDGLRDYIRSHRQRDYTKNLTRKLLAYALGRSLILSDDILVDEIDRGLAQNGYRLEALVESIVASKQFLYKRGSTQVAQR